MRFVILIKQPQVHISFMLPIFRPALTNKLCMYVCMCKYCIVFIQRERERDESCFAGRNLTFNLILESKTKKDFKILDKDCHIFLLVFEMRIWHCIKT